MGDSVVDTDTAGTELGEVTNTREITVKITNVGIQYSQFRLTKS